MKKILSISMGSSSRNHSAVHEFLGEQCKLSRIGFNADIQKAIAAYKEYGVFPLSRGSWKLWGCLPHKIPKSQNMTAKWTPSALAAWSFITKKAKP